MLLPVPEAPVLLGPIIPVPLPEVLRPEERTPVGPMALCASDETPVPVGFAMESPLLEAPVALRLMTLVLLIEVFRLEE